MLGQIVGSAINTIGGLFTQERNFQQQKKENQKDRQFQSLEAEKNRIFNSEEAATQRQFAADQADLAYERNTLGNQISQMKAAGLNPAMMYSQGNFQAAQAPSGAAASSSSSPSGGHGHSPVAPVDLNVARQIAEIDLIKSQSRKNDAEGSILESDASFRDAFNSGNLALQGVDIALKQSLKVQSDAEASQARRAAEELQTRAENNRAILKQIGQSLESGQLDIDAKKIDNFYKSRQYEAILDNLAADTGKKRAEVNIAFQKLGAELKKLESSAQLDAVMSGFYNALGIKATYEAESYRLNNEEANNIRQCVRDLGVFGVALDGVSHFLGKIMPFKF